jgi:glycosyltransferase involved in cell wall biosynthesis
MLVVAGAYVRSQWQPHISTNRTDPAFAQLQSWQSGSRSRRLAIVLVSGLLYIPLVIARGARKLGQLARQALRSARPAGYQALQKTLMKGHRSFLFIDYASRSKRFVREQADTAIPTVVHAHDINTLLPGYLAARATEGRLVYDSHELHMGTTYVFRMNRFRRWLLRRTERLLIRRADCTITVNESISQILSDEYGVDAPLVVRNCPEDSRPPSRRNLLRDELGISPDVRIALYHGNLAPHRGLEELVASALHLKDVAIVFLGTGPLAEELPELASKLGVAKHVMVQPAVPPDILLDYVSSADVGVLPIQAIVPNYRFSLPNKLFECLLAGVPVAVADLPEIASVVRREKVGEIFDPTQTVDIARAIKEILSRADYSELRSHCRDVAIQRHTWSFEAEKLVSMYEELKVRPDQVTSST